MAYYVLGLFCGIRAAEIRRLGWSNVNEDKGFVFVPGASAKTRSHRLVTLEPNAIAWMHWARELRSTLPPVNLWRQFRRALAATGLAWEQNILRHSFCSYHYALYDDAERTAKEAGHSERMLFAHYRALAGKESAERFWNIYPQ